MQNLKEYLVGILWGHRNPKGKFITMLENKDFYIGIKTSFRITDEETRHGVIIINNKVDKSNIVTHHKFKCDDLLETSFWDSLNVELDKLSMKREEIYKLLFAKLLVNVTTNNESDTLTNLFFKLFKDSKRLEVLLSYIN